MKAGKELLILPKQKLIFFLSSKCASSSIRRMAINDLRYRDKGDPNRGLKYLQPEDLPKYKDFLKIMVVRNPWSRMVAIYIDKTQRTFYQGFRDLSMYKRMPFMAFVRVVAETEDAKVDAHLWAQTIFALNDRGRLIPDILIRLEKIHVGWPALQRQVLSITGARLPDLGHHNKSKHGPYQQYYDEESARLVEKRYRQDIETLNYHF